MTCPSCSANNDEVVDSRLRKGSPEHVWRRRECLDCGTAWVTHEIAVRLIKRRKKRTPEKVYLDFLEKSVKERKKKSRKERKGRTGPYPGLEQGIPESLAREDWEREHGGKTNE